MSIYLTDQCSLTTSNNTIIGDLLTHKLIKTLLSLVIKVEWFKEPLDFIQDIILEDVFV